MGLENSNSSQPLASSDQTVEPLQESSPAARPEVITPAVSQEIAPQLRSARFFSDAPLDSSLSSIMQSLTPNASKMSGDSTPQYPSLEAAVGMEQQIAPTLTNLLAAKTHDNPNFGLGNAGLTAAGVPMGSQSSIPASSSAVSSPPAHLDSVPSVSSLQDEQGPLAGEVIAVELPQSTPEAKPSQTVNPDPAASLSQKDSPEEDASWEAIIQGSIAAPSETSTTRVVASPGADATPIPMEEVTAASQEVAATEDPAEKALEDRVEEDRAEEAKIETELTPTQAATADRPGEKVDGQREEAEDAQPDNEDFDQVKAGAAEGDRAQQVLIKREETHVAVIFPEEEINANPDVALDFIDSQLWQDLQQRLSGGTAFASDTPVHLYSQNCLLDTRQFQELDEALGRFNLKLVRIITRRRQTAVAAAMSGYSTDQTSSLPELLSKEVHSPQKMGMAEPLYLQKNIRSGTEIRHPGSVIIMGDLNPGSSIIADGDILVWGRLRGIAHAGATGNQASIVMALKLEAPQLRIAGAVARVDTQGNSNPAPEIAYINNKAIRITSAYSFNRNELG